ncbi:hypothetical protein OUZ56_024964 [Daphnia magna]|uniref:Uncharacterized protein n=1 Tax=Daphnia magna TaxID=35525 RepID=A0ABQ9ZJ58_9CRUS|nr:hypothetical protein OUZ56_024964 [Daphnia magna]
MKVAVWIEPANESSSATVLPKKQTTNQLLLTLTWRNKLTLAKWMLVMQRWLNGNPRVFTTQFVNAESRGMVRPDFSPLDRPKSTVV